MSNLVQTRLEMARAGENPTVICRMETGWAVLGDWQFLPGYSILIADPVVGDLHHLVMDQRLQFLRDMSLLGEAIFNVTTPLRMNYQILGNLDAQLHAHVCPRYEWEDEDKRKKSTPCYDKKAGPHFDVEEHNQLKVQIALTLKQLGGAI